MNPTDSSVPAVKPNSILRRFVAALRRHWLFADETPFVRPVMQRLGEDRVNGLALSVRGVRSMHQIHEAPTKQRNETQERLRLEADDYR